MSDETGKGLSAAERMFMMGDEEFLALSVIERAELTKAAWLEMIERDKDKPELLDRAMERIRKNIANGEEVLRVWEILPFLPFGGAPDEQQHAIDGIKLMQGTLREILDAILAARIAHESH